MAGLIEAARRVVGRGTDLESRVAGLEQAADAARGRVDDAVVDEASAVVGRAEARLRLSGEHTIVALGGSTGSGKSSLFNALCGLDLAAVGLKRPTTSWALACAWGPGAAGDLLDWLGIPPRHQIDRMSLLDTSSPEADLQGLVLLDMPDHDSTEVLHHLEVERLVTLADVLVWVVDPQKYADAALHERFLRPLRSYGDVMMVVLNHIDEIPAGAVGDAVADLERLLVEDGLDAPVLATSATRGDGLGELRAAIVERVARKRAARQRLTADVKRAAEALLPLTGGESGREPDRVTRDVRAGLVDACAAAAGVPQVADAIEASSLRRAEQLTGWPVTRWATRLRPDPLRRLHLDVGAATGSTGASTDLSTGAVPRTSIAQPTPVQRARVDAAVRAVADEASVALARPWQESVRRASVGRSGDLADALDRALGTTDLGLARRPLWWRAVNVVQWLLMLVAVVGLIGLVTFVAMGSTWLANPGSDTWRQPVVSSALLVGGVVLGLLLGLLCAVLARRSARRRAERAEARLHDAVGHVVDDLVLAPVQSELEAHARCRAGLAAALG